MQRLTHGSISTQSSRAVYRWMHWALRTAGSGSRAPACKRVQAGNGRRR